MTKEEIKIAKHNFASIYDIRWLNKNASRVYA